MDEDSRTLWRFKLNHRWCWRTPWNGNSRRHVQQWERHWASQVCKLHRGLIWRRQYWSVSRVNLELIYCPSLQNFGLHLIQESIEKYGKKTLWCWELYSDWSVNGRCEADGIYQTSIQSPLARYCLPDCGTKACILAKEICQLSVAS